MPSSQEVLSTRATLRHLKTAGLRFTVLETTTRATLRHLQTSCLLKTSGLLFTVLEVTTTTTLRYLKTQGLRFPVSKQPWRYTSMYYHNVRYIVTKSYDSSFRILRSPLHRLNHTSTLRLRTYTWSCSPFEDRHTKTLMSKKADRTLKWIPSMCCLGRTPRTKNKGRS